MGDGSGEARITSVRRVPTETKGWQSVDGDLAVPDGVRTLRIMVWADRNMTGRIHCDDITMEPVTEAETGLP